MKLNLKNIINERAKLVDQAIISVLPKEDSRLAQAMRYSALSPGKRLRPFILIETSKLFNVNQDYALRAAAAVEIIHSYSLIHDDLPAMDNDDFRRGMPSCHKKFGEAAAILAGDSLLTLAFEVLSDKKTHPSAEIRCQLVQILAKNIGIDGMAGGQMLDLIYEKEVLADFDKLLYVQLLKTAKLFVACCEMAAAIGEAEPDTINNLIEFSKNFGFAFQLMDDYADISEKKEISNNNMVKFIGAEKTFALAKEYIEASCNYLTKINAVNSTNILKELAKNIIHI